MFFLNFIPKNLMHILYALLISTVLFLLGLIFQFKKLYLLQKELVLSIEHIQNLKSQIELLNYSMIGLAKPPIIVENSNFLSKIFEFNNTQLLGGSICIVLGIVVYYYCCSTTAIFIPMRLITEIDKFGNKIKLGIMHTPDLYVGANITPFGGTVEMYMTDFVNIVHNLNKLNCVDPSMHRLTLLISKNIDTIVSPFL